ncbi:MAG: hypothetical protein HY739_15215 [Desulfobacterales bacterium]|nr:hypothetical protein [Desulfobacterales bacterium]
MSDIKESITRFGNDLEDIFSERRAVVFLCGPSSKDLDHPGAQLRVDLEEALKQEGFEVILGEDDGLESLRHKYSNYAHENELMFIQKHCNAVILIASSVGAYCELGLFSYKKVHDLESMTDFILIISNEYENVQSFLIEGPAAAIDDFGKVFYGDLSNFDYSNIIKRLRRRRSVYFTSHKGRPPSFNE